MGNIKSLMVKKTAKELVEKYPERFTKDYLKNKEELNKIMQINSKSIKNMLAGYITHISGKSTIPSLDLQKFTKEDAEKDKKRFRRRRR